MTDAYIARGAVRADLDVLAPILSQSFAEPARVILTRGHTDDSIAYRRAELEHWFLQCTTETGAGNAGTAVGQIRLMVVCDKKEPNAPIGFCQYEMVEPGMKHGQFSAKLPAMPPFPAGGDKEQYYLWKEMIFETRKAALGHCRHANIISMVVDSKYRGKNNYARRAISDYCAVHYLAWGDIPNYNDAYPRAAPLWIRSGYKYLDKEIKLPYKYASKDETNPTKEIAFKRGQNIPQDKDWYITVPQIRWKVADRDVQDRMAPSRAAKAKL
ncbi:unnamed protein product [Sympodiomycopsis kandeliae]